MAQQAACERADLFLVKIAITHFRIISAGGLETRLLNYVSHFIREGNEVTIIHAKRDSSLLLPGTVRLLRIPVRWLPRQLRMWWFGYRSHRILQGGNFDLSLSLGRTPGQQLLICPGTHRGFLHAMGRKIYSPPDLLNVYLDAKAFRTSKIILAASKMISDELRKLYNVPAEKIRVLYPPSDPHVFNFNHRTTRAYWQRHFGVHPLKKNFLFVSSGHLRKGLPLLLDVFRHLKKLPVHLWIAGSSVKTSLPANVSYLGFVRNMAQLYSAMDATIHPALYEPFGQIVSESLMCGTPVIISHKTGASELVLENEGMVVQAFETESWLNAIKQFLDKRWNVPEGFAERNGITPSKHVEALVTAWIEIGEWRH
ncbi:MAG TPA: glycosyltransferase family 4 protein [Chitinophagales bacterium]|nr:glycosyltransferase family 4 protein [Chitinophagales bacterium]